MINLEKDWDIVRDLLSSGYLNRLKQDSTIILAKDITNIVSDYYLPSFTNIQKIKTSEMIQEYIEFIDRYWDNEDEKKTLENAFITNLVKSDKLFNVMRDLKKSFKLFNKSELTNLMQFYFGLLFLWKPKKSGFQWLNEYDIFELFALKIKDIDDENGLKSLLLCVVLLFNSNNDELVAHKLEETKLMDSIAEKQDKIDKDQEYENIYNVFINKYYLNSLDDTEKI